MRPSIVSRCLEEIKKLLICLVYFVCLSPPEILPCSERFLKENCVITWVSNIHFHLKISKYSHWLYLDDFDTPISSKNPFVSYIPNWASIFSCANTMTGRNTTNHTKNIVFFILLPSFRVKVQKKRLHGAQESPWSHRIEDFCAKLFNPFRDGRAKEMATFSLPQFYLEQWPAQRNFLNKIHHITK